MKKIPFDIKFRPQIESGEYIVIDRFNYKLHFVKEENGVFFFTVRYPGCNYDTERLYDHPENHLFIVNPKEDLSEFEYAMLRYVQDAANKKDDSEIIESTKKHSAELLSLAKKELEEEIPELEFEPIEETLEYKAGYRAGKAETLKDLPRWREWGNGAAGNSDGHPIALVSGAGGIRFVSVLSITGEKYIMLDDLKKLPGFKKE